MLSRYTDGTPAAPSDTVPLEGSTLLVASSGGHLKELHALRPRLHLGSDVDWVTFDTPQARSLLDGETVRYVRFVGPRRVVDLLRNLRPATRILRAGDYQRVISTGSGLALAFLPLASSMGIACHYIESAARQGGPSLTGRLLGPIPGVRCYSQSVTWTTRRWRHGGSVFDGFESTVVGEPAIRRVVVTLGTLSFGFRRLIERLLDILPTDAEVVWQTGGTDVTGLPIEAREQVPADQLGAAMRAADVVISHAGIGSALSALESGHCPVVAPRAHARGEHVDDHQAFIAADLESRGLAVSRAADDITFADLVLASQLRVCRRDTPPPFILRD